MRTLGIDLSANAAKTGACVIDWDPGTVQFLDRPTEDAELVAAALEADMVAIDVPLGWPDGFVDAVVAHHSESGWPPVGTPPPADRLPLRYRRTDLVIQTSGARPLSVSSDRIGVSAMRGARLQYLLRRAGIDVDRSGMSGRVIETYPAAALRHWGLTSSKYKGPINAEACRLLASDLTIGCGFLAGAASARLLGCDDDGLDAFVCALIARAALAGHTTGPDAQDIAMARREGWIHVPTVGLADIVAAG